MNVRLPVCVEIILPEAVFENHLLFSLCFGLYFTFPLIMPPTKQNLPKRLRILAEEYKDDSVVCEDRKLICRCCGYNIGPDNEGNMKKWAVTQHTGSSKHKSNIELYSKQKTLAFDKDTFFTDICQAFVSADIPLFKLNNPMLRECWEKYSGRKLPEQSTIRKNYVNETYEVTMTAIRQEIGDSLIWVSIDETADANGRFIANVIVGKLSATEASRPLLRNVAQLEKTNNQTIASLFNTSMSLLWPDGEGVRHSKVLLFVTDAAPYMVKSAVALKIFYPNMLHVTCIAHALHRIAETVRSKYKLVDTFISSMKKIFVKAPGRVTAFHEMYPNVSLPPKPILTRWGTWLTTVAYYAEHLNEIETFVNSLEAEEAAAIGEVQKKFRTKKGKLSIDIMEIEQYYKGIADTINKFETKSFPLVDAVELWTNTISLLSNSPHEVVANKAISVSQKNPDLAQMTRLAENDESVLALHPFNNFSPAQLAQYRFAPLVSCDVERSFSMLKSVLRDNRRCFTVDNLKQHLVIGSFTTL